MEINKEREAFEKAMKSRAILDLDYVQYHEISNKYVIQNGLKGEYFKTALDCSHVVNVAWMMWQAKATPEGFVLVPKESLKVALYWMDENIDAYHVPNCAFAELFEHKPILEKALEAQEQSHD